MKIGVLKEIKNNENRVALTPKSVKLLKKAGNSVFVQKNAGLGSGFTDKEYRKAGAKIVKNAKKICKKCRLIVKIKEPMPKEYSYFNKENILFTYFHFASSKKLTLAMKKSKTTCIAYETVEKNGKLPLLKPMSEVAGKMSAIMGAYYLAKPYGGRGTLMSPVKNSVNAKTVILGGGIVGTAALENSLGLGANVVLFEVNSKRIKQLKKKFPKAKYKKSSKKAIEKELKNTDLLIGAVLVPGAKAPKLVSKKMVKLMPKNSVIVDVAVDQGGSVETIKPTTHAKPVYEKFGVKHYAVANMPGAYPRTSTIALTNATVPYILKLAKNDLNAVKKDKGLASGVNMHKSFITNESVAKAFGLKYTDLKKVL